MAAMGTRTTTKAAWVRRALFGTILVVALTIGGTAFRVWQVARIDDRTKADVIIVLGAAQYNGRPSPIFQSRLRHAEQLYEAGVASVIITAGGNRTGDEYTEASAGAQWLEEQGVPEASVLSVGEGSDTLGSLRAVAVQVAQHHWRTAVLVSDPWHSLRARTMAEDVGIESWTSPTHSGPVVQARHTQALYIFRETGALLFYLLTKTPADDIGGTGLG
jgi:uncharacterized SAM-binding protein YcdF (DUF218 family)